MEVDNDERAATNKFRHREATKWNQLDGTASLLPGDQEYDETTQDAAGRAASAAIIEQMRAETEVLTISASSQAQDLYTNEICENIDRLFAAVPPPDFPLITQQIVDELFNTNPVISPSLIDKTIKQKKTYVNPNHQLNIVDNNEPLPPSHHRIPPTMEITPDTDGQLNPKQHLLLQQCKTYFQALSVSRSSRLPPPPPIYKLVHGPPGVGKSYVTHQIVEAAAKLGIEVGCCAYMGHPATNMPLGRTVHNYLGIPVMETNQMYKWSSPPSIQSLGQTLTHFDREKIGMIIIDEASMIQPQFLAEIDQKLRILTGNFNDAFGNIAILLMGDFYQIPTVQCKITLPAAALKKDLVECSEDPVIHGAWLFTLFNLIELDQQMRAANDPAHMTMLHRMRIPHPGQNPICEYDLNRHKYLSYDDIITDPSWTEAPVVVVDNKTRITLNAVRSKYFAHTRGKIRIGWNCPLAKCSSQLSQQQTNQLYRDNIILKEFFVPEAPGYLLSNLNPSLGLANGTPIIYHSLVLDDREDDQCIKQQVHDVTHSTDIFLVHQPKFICVEVPSADPAKFIGLTLVPGRVVIPISLKKNLGSKYWKLQVDGLGVIQTQMKIHDVSLKFALTAHKEQFIILSFKYCQSFIVLLFYLYQVQGQTCKKVIIDLNKQPRYAKPRILHSTLYVTFYRVRSSQDIRLLRGPSKGCFEHLVSLKPDEDIVKWLKGFDTTTGVWNRDRCHNDHQQFP